ncbi:MAG TPA: RNA 2',3'-cyclic phosphodiesterase [Dehalococcoidia bacterium]|jgi:2'-5' RNA ligase|nr:RNA 2',3'-cyclic phosphodiesterase [Dehalococcoidia bacterium]
MRVFVAIELPEAWRDAARSVRREIEGGLDDDARARLRWVDPSLLHLTLRFIGEVDQQRATTISEALDAMAVTKPIDVALALTAAGTFGPAGRTQVVWLGIDGDESGLARLAASVESAVVSSGVRADERDFRPHVTLARVHRRASRTERRAIAEAVASVAPPAVTAASEFRARGVALVRSDLGNDGPTYTALTRTGGGDLPSG